MEKKIASRQTRAPPPFPGGDDTSRRKKPGQNLTKDTHLYRDTRGFSNILSPTPPFPFFSSVLTNFFLYFFTSQHFSAARRIGTCHRFSVGKAGRQVVLIIIILPFFAFFAYTATEFLYLSISIKSLVANFLASENALVLLCF